MEPEPMIEMESEKKWEEVNETYSGNHAVEMGTKARKTYKGVCEAYKGGN